MRALQLRLHESESGKFRPTRRCTGEGGAKAFINKGVNGRCRDVTDADNQKYERMAIEKLGPECAHWLKTGEAP